MTKSAYTRVSVIAHVLEVEDFLAPEERAILAKMHASLSKPRTKSDAPSKTAIENAKLANDLVVFMERCGEPVTAKMITEHVTGITSPQKAVAVVKAADGRVVRFYEGRKTFYRLA